MQWLWEQLVMLHLKSPNGKTGKEVSEQAFYVCRRNEEIRRWSLPLLLPLIAAWVIALIKERKLPDTNDNIKSNVLQH
jgi:hypothetical protein